MNQDDFGGMTKKSRFLATQRMDNLYITTLGEYKYFIGRIKFYLLFHCPKWLSKFLALGPDVDVGDQLGMLGYVPGSLNNHDNHGWKC